MPRTRTKPVTKNTPVVKLGMPVECTTCGRDGRWVPGEPTVQHDGPWRTCVVRLPVDPVAPAAPRSAA